jgi:hypothetical protein
MLFLISSPSSSRTPLLESGIWWNKIVLVGRKSLQALEHLLGSDDLAAHAETVKHVL